MKIGKISAMLLILTVGGLAISSSSCRTVTNPSSEFRDNSDEDGNESSSPQYQRFDKLLAMIEDVTKNATSSEDAAQLIGTGEVREVIYQLQALARIYESDFRVMKDIRSEFEELENGIGEFNKWTQLTIKLEEKNKPTAESVENRDHAFKKLVKLIEKRGWFGSAPSRGVTLRIQLQKLDWKKPSKDKKYVLNYLANEAQQYNDTNYKMDQLESKSGLHELRRDMKWLILEMKSLNGQVMTVQSNCQYNDFSQLPNDPIAKSKYAKLPVNAATRNPCLIEECLFLGLVNSVDVLGKLKDKAEEKSAESDNDSDNVSNKIVRAAEEHYDFIKSSKLFKRIGKALNECIPGNH